jgi:hypothetical protein
MVSETPSLPKHTKSEILVHREANFKLPAVFACKKVFSLLRFKAMLANLCRPTAKAIPFNVHPREHKPKVERAKRCSVY